MSLRPHIRRLQKGIYKAIPLNHRMLVSSFSIFVVAIWSLSGCYTTHNIFGSRISYIGLTPEPKAATSIGQVTNKDCTADLDDGFRSIRKDQKIKYLRNVSIDFQVTVVPIPPYGATVPCYLIKGEGFK